MNDLLTVNDTLLDEMFELEAKCQSAHLEAVSSECLHEVTHCARYTCGPSKLICSNAARKIWASIELGYWACGDCNKRLADCWTVTPA